MLYNTNTNTHSKNLIPPNLSGHLKFKPIAISFFKINVVLYYIRKSRISI